MTLETFLIKLGGVGFNIILIVAYWGIRRLIKGREYMWSGTSQEREALRQGSVSLNDLRDGIWGVNTAKVTAYGSFGLGTVVLAAIFIYEQNLSGYDALFFYILLGFVAFSMIAYFLSIQLWFMVMDIGGTIETKIFYRTQATWFQVVGWYSIHISILLSILAVNTVVGYIFSVINMAAAVYLIELKAVVYVRERHEASTMNEFQENLDISTIYEKNKDFPLQEFQKQEVRILNWNIERGFHPEKLLKYIQSEDPDIVALQEVDWGNERTEYLDILQYLAEELDMKGYFGIEFFEIDSPYRKFKFAAGGVHGNAILTKIQPSEVYRIELPVLYDWQNPPKGYEAYAKIEKRLGNRFAICADFKIGNQTLTVCSAHFEDKYGGVDGRIRQWNHLHAELEKRSSTDEIQVVAGDINTLDNWLVRMIGLSKREQAQQKPWRTPECVWWNSKVFSNSDFQDPFTCKDWTVKQSFLYREKLDWILVKNASVIDSGLGDFNSSDHKPTWAVISLEV